MAAFPIVVSGAVEGPSDEAVLRRIVRNAGAELGPVRGLRGKPAVLESLRGYNQAAERCPWVVLVDLDTSNICAPPAVLTWLPNPATLMCFRVVVHAIEAWLMGDSEQLAAFLGIPQNRISLAPEAIRDPKKEMVNLARRSRRRDIREDMVPRPESGRALGLAYTARMIEFATTMWRPDVAAIHSDSLRRFDLRLREMLGRAAGLCP